MHHKIAAVDDYIKQSAPFAQPILNRIRAIVHKACPYATEAIKWGMPHFIYNGKNLCCMAAFKAHCSVSLLYVPKEEHFQNLLKHEQQGGMGQLGKLHSVSDLPESNSFEALLKAIMAYIDHPPPASKTNKPKASRLVVMHPELAKAFEQHPSAKTFFDQLSPSHQYEYTQWITEAKTEPTQIKRIATTIEWLLEGKHRNWKYKRK